MFLPSPWVSPSLFTMCIVFVGHVTCDGHVSLVDPMAWREPCSDPTWLLMRGGGILTDHH